MEIVYAILGLAAFAVPVVLAALLLPRKSRKMAGALLSAYVIAYCFLSYCGQYVEYIGAAYVTAICTPARSPPPESLSCSFLLSMYVIGRLWRLRFLDRHGLAGKRARPRLRQLVDDVIQV